MIKYFILAFTISLFSCEKVTGNAPKNEIDVTNTDSIVDVDNQINDEDSDKPTTQIEYFLYIGTYTNDGSKGIYLSQFNEESGELSTPQVAAELNNASFQCIVPEKKQLWSVSEAWGGEGMVMAYDLNVNDGSLSLAGNYSTQGKGPCYVDFHNSSQSAIVANYSTGNVARIASKESIYDHQHTGKSIHPTRQKKAHAHCFKTDLKGEYAYSCDLGTDKVYVYDLRENGLILHDEIEITPGGGPRHLDFHPEMKAMAVINELNSTIELFIPDSNGIFNQRLAVESTIPSDFTENNQCADIHYSNDGNYLFASNRGYNSIVAFKVNKETMKLELVGHMQEEIDWPRNFTLSPNNKFLLVANQNSNSITIYENNEGNLKYTNTKIDLSQPVCLTFLEN